MEKSRLKGIRKAAWMLDEEEIEVVFRKVKKARHIRIHVSSPNRVLVTGSPYVPFRALELFFKRQHMWVVEKIRHFQKFPNKTIQLSESQYKKKKEPARKLVLEKLAYWNQYYGFVWRQVAIRNQRTRWGSCSNRRTLSYHAGIVDLPEALQDYLVVHELCHLEAMNHGASFWKLVEKTQPKAKIQDGHLKKYVGKRIL